MFHLKIVFDLQGKITAQGKLLLRGPLICTDISPPETNVGKPKELQVFLFEQSIIFSEAFGKKTQFTSPSYNYRAHIQVIHIANNYINCCAYLFSAGVHCRFNIAFFLCEYSNLSIHVLLKYGKNQMFTKF